MSVKLFRSAAEKSTDPMCALRPGAFSGFFPALQSRKQLIDFFAWQKANQPNGITPYDSSNSIRVFGGFNIDSAMGSISAQHLQPGNATRVNSGFHLPDFIFQGFKKRNIGNRRNIPIETTLRENNHFFSSLICRSNFFLNAETGRLPFSFIPSVINSAKYMSSRFLPFWRTFAWGIVPMSCATRSASRLFLNAASNRAAIVFLLNKDRIFSALRYCFLLFNKKLISFRSAALSGFLPKSSNSVVTDIQHSLPSKWLAIRVWPFNKYIRGLVSDTILIPLITLSLLVRERVFSPFYFA